jgi:hypothetical protein
MESFRRTLYTFIEKSIWPNELSPEEGYDLEVLDSRAPGYYANYRLGEVTFSREKTHTGNSIVSYKKEGTTRFGCIQEIEVLKSQQVVFHVLPYLPLPDNSVDRFSRYAPHFPAQVLSTERGRMDAVKGSAIKNHCARYEDTKKVVMIELDRVRV